MKIPALVQIDPAYWRGRRVLVTGHTGFKGAWLCLWLQALGADLTGIAPGSPPARGLYRLARVGERMRELAVDVRDARGVLEALRASRAEVVVAPRRAAPGAPLAAGPGGNLRGQRDGHRERAGGRARAGAEVRAVVVVTLRQVLREPLCRCAALPRGRPSGGADPYSSSKAVVELVTSAYRRSFFAQEGSPRVASVRAGNVIGGGDRAQSRLLADSVRAVESGETLRVRNPHAVRAWQHVLNPLGGYLRLAEVLQRRPAAARAWNFGPPPRDALPVSWIVERLSELWDGTLRWQLDERASPPEAPRLELDSSDAERELGWSPPWDLADALRMLVEWHRAELAGEDMREVSLVQIARHMGAPGL